MEFAPIYLFLAVFIVLILGYPVALSLAGTGLVAAAIGIISGSFDAALLYAIPSRLFGIISNQTLVAVPLFIFMGVTLIKIVVPMIQEMIQVLVQRMVLPVLIQLAWMTMRMEHSIAQR